MSKYQKIIFILLCGVILIGGLVPFAAQFICPFIFPDRPIAGAEVWNQYVSIVLGIVATILSIVSLKMCFISEEQTNSTNLRVQKALDDLDKSIGRVSDKQDLIVDQVKETQKQLQPQQASSKDWLVNSNDENKNI